MNSKFVHPKFHKFLKLHVVFKHGQQRNITTKWLRKLDCYLSIDMQAIFTFSSAIFYVDGY